MFLSPSWAKLPTACLQPFVVEFSDRFGAECVGHVASAEADAVLEFGRIGAVPQHLKVIVGFDDYGVGLGSKAQGFFRHMAYIGHYHEVEAVYLYGVPDRLGGIVRDFEPMHPDPSGDYLRPSFLLEYPGAGADPVPGHGVV